MIKPTLIATILLGLSTTGFSQTSENNAQKIVSEEAMSSTNNSKLEISRNETTKESEVGSVNKKKATGLPVEKNNDLETPYGKAPKRKMVPKF